MKLEWIDHRPIHIPRLSKYPGGISFPGKKTIIEVNDIECKKLLKMRNGQSPVFKEVSSRREKKPVDYDQPIIMEKDDG